MLQQANDDVLAAAVILPTLALFDLTLSDTKYLVSQSIIGLTYSPCMDFYQSKFGRRPRF